MSKHCCMAYFYYEIKPVKIITQEARVLLVRGEKK